MPEFDAYLMPQIDEPLERIGLTRYITTLDLWKGYWQVALEPASRKLLPRETRHSTVEKEGLAIS